MFSRCCCLLMRLRREQSLLAANSVTLNRFQRTAKSSESRTASWLTSQEDVKPWSMNNSRIRIQQIRLKEMARSFLIFWLYTSFPVMFCPVGWFDYTFDADTIRKNRQHILFFIALRKKEKTRFFYFIYFFLTDRGIFRINKIRAGMCRIGFCFPSRLNKYTLVSSTFSSVCSPVRCDTTHESSAFVSLLICGLNLGKGGAKKKR